MKNRFLLVGAIFMALGVIFGAFGAHALKEIVSAKQLANWQTGVLYQFLHALALIALAPSVVSWSKKRAQITLILFCLGILLFSGSLFGLATIEQSAVRKVIGPLTPIGGLCFIAGWLAVVLNAIRHD